MHEQAQPRVGQLFPVLPLSAVQLCSPLSTVGLIVAHAAVDHYTFLQCSVVL